VLRGQLGGIGTVVDGSGLSSRDRQSATGELTVLTVAEQGVNAPAFTAILPIACTDGTLVHRMCGTAAAGRVRAKTGTLPSVYSLSGYTTTADHHEVRFAFLLAQAPSSANARAAIDACVVHLSTLRVS
jgi:D-alanyl-D-alanine carboxypeptidase/D-alanyl-D-alanine-endopeptidase (penicillin-binding protein 4)